jgi:hypothetical protein
LGLVATSIVTCAAVVLGMGFGSGGAPSAAVVQAKKEAKRVTKRFLSALDQGHYGQACSLLARQFYRRHHVPGRKQCVMGLHAGMAGTAVKFRITGVDAKRNSARVHAVVDGAPGIVVLVRESGSFRVLDQQAS